MINLEMDLRLATFLLSERWAALPDNVFEEAFGMLVKEYEVYAESRSWLADNPSATDIPGESCWEGLVRYPDASLMHYRACRVNGVKVYVTKDYINELL
jgi:hypothetical protein